MTAMTEIFDNVYKSLLHFDGTNTGTTFTDAIGRTWTAHGNAQTSTAQKVFGSASGLFDGTGDYIGTPHDNDFNFGTGDFTIDCRIRLSALPGPSGGNEFQIIGQHQYPSNGWGLFLYGYSGGGVLLFVQGFGPLFFGYSFSTDTWYHLAVVRSAGVVKCYINGTAIDAGQALASWPSTTNAISIGADTDGDGTPYNGYIDEMRIIKGRAMWTGDFTPPTAAYAGTDIDLSVNQWKRYYLAISHPETVMTARINQTFSSLDGVNQLTYDGADGSYADILPGMTCWVGSSAGARDVGIVRVRKFPTSDTLYIGKTSGIAFADNLYLTIVNDFGLWGREPIDIDGETFADEDIEYDNVTSLAPIVRAGPAVVVLERIDSTVTHSPTLTAWSPVGDSMASYSTDAPGASYVGNSTTANPVIEYDTDGEYYEAYTVTDTSGRVTTVTRKVIVNPSLVEVSPPEISGDIDSGGWSFRIEGYQDVTIADLYERAMCVLIRRDYNGPYRVPSVGRYADCENIRAWGWLDEESLSINTQYGTAEFTVQGPAYWLDQITGAPMLVEDSTSPLTWGQMADLTTDRALYRLIHWHSTLDLITDVTLTGNETPIKFANINTGSLYQQISGLLSEKLIGRFVFDRFGCGFAYIPPSLLDAADKAALTVRLDVNAGDWVEQVDIPRDTVNSSAMVEISGTSWDGTTEAPLYSRAPGNYIDHYGGVNAPYSTLAFNDQDDANRISGDVYALENNECPTVDIVLWARQDYLDLPYSELVTLTLAAGDTPRGIAWADKRLVPEAIAYEYDAETGAENTVVTLAAETDGADGVDYFPPEPADTDDWGVPGLGDLPPIVPPATDWFPPSVPPPPVTGGCGEFAPQNSFALSWSKGIIDGGDSELSSYAYFPCKLRPASAFYGNSYIELYLVYYGDAAGKVHAYAIDSGQNRVLTGVISGGAEGWALTRIDFNPVSELDVAGFEIELEAGTGVPEGTGTVWLYNESTQLFADGGNTASISWVSTNYNANNVKVAISGTGTDVSTIFPVGWQGITRVKSDAFGTPVYGFVSVSLGTPGLRWTPNSGQNWYEESGSFSSYAGLASPDDAAAGTLTVETIDSGQAYGALSWSAQLWLSTDPNISPRRQVLISNARVHNVCTADEV